MIKDLNYYLSLPYKIGMVKDVEEGGYALSCPELPGCITCAETKEAGLQKIEQAKEAWLAVCLEEGLDIPVPENTSSYSGQFKLRNCHEIKPASRNVEDSPHGFVRAEQVNKTRK